MKATARQAREKGEAARLAEREAIVAEFNHAMDALDSNSRRLLAEGLALEKFACDTGQPVANRLICIRAALRAWRELHSLQSEVLRMAMLFAAGRSPIPDDSAEDIAALKAAGQHVLNTTPRNHEQLRQWIAEGEKLETDLEAVTKNSEDQDNWSERIPDAPSETAMKQQAVANYLAAVARLIPEAEALDTFAQQRNRPVKSRLVCINAALARLRHLHAIESAVRRVFMVQGLIRPLPGTPEDIARKIEVARQAGEEGLKLSADNHEGWRRLIARAEKLQKRLIAANKPEVDNTGSPVGEINFPVYNNQFMDTASAYAIVARDLGKSVEDLQKLRTDEAARAPVPARPVAAALPASTAAALEWPSEKWKGSPEHLSRKQRAIFPFLRRVWKPFIENIGAVVTRQMLRDSDRDAEVALGNALRSCAMPADIRIVPTRELKKSAGNQVMVMRAIAHG